MKNKIALASAFVAASSFSSAEIVLNDFLSVEGFVDMSYLYTDFDDGNENSFTLDQVEIVWLFDFDPVTAQIDLNYFGGDVDDVEIVEQAFATYHFDNGGAITAGLYASMLGFESFEPTGLYQYSFAYGIDVLLPGYSNGVKFTYETDTTFFGISIQDEAYDNGATQFGGNPGPSTYGVEIAGSISMENGLS
ncbi:MAG: outer membrane beta-barrel protein, partial [Opitutales bacterium]